MKKILALVFALVLCVGLVACGGTDDPAKTPEGDDPSTDAVTVMTWEEFMAAELDAEVTVEAYVQAHQAWWTRDDGKSVITVYAQAPDGGYYLYEMACSEEDSAKLTEGTKIRVTGYKAEWAGEVEIVDATFEILEGNWVAKAADLTDLLGKDEMIDHQNEKALFKGMTVESVVYQNGTRGKDIYVALNKDGATYTFCVESYLTDPDSDLYKAVEALQAGDVVDVEGFVYWYEGLNTHITAVTLVSGAVVDDPNTKSEGVMTWEEYNAAELNAEVTIEAYVQAHQSWWQDDAGNGWITIYAQDPQGGYYLYEMPCTEEQAALLTAGTKIKATGFKAEWSGEVEIVDGSIEILEGNWVAEAADLTDLLGTDDMIKHQNEKALFKGLTFESFAYQNDTPGKDIYVTFTKDGATYSFCVESYLTNSESDLYKAVEALQAGDVVDVEGFVYWYEGLNTHMTAVTPAN